MSTEMLKHFVCFIETTSSYCTKIIGTFSAMSLIPVNEVHLLQVDTTSWNIYTQLYKVNQGK